MPGRLLPAKNRRRAKGRGMNTTLDQWEVLEAVIQLGSFAAAAEKMNRSQSTISYAISRLQEQFQIPLLEIKGRRAQLTESGKALLADAGPLLKGFRALEQRATSVGSGGETEIRVSVDSLFPGQRLFGALADLRQSSPHVLVQLRQGVFLTPVQEFACFDADLCITGLHSRECFAKPVLDVRMLAVARADHPLHALGRQLSRADMVQSLAVVIEGSSTRPRKNQPHDTSQRLLTVDNVDGAIEAVHSGLCFGWLPVYRIASLLESEEFVPLRLPLGGERLVRLFLIYKEVDEQTPEKNHLATLLGADREVETL